MHARGPGYEALRRGRWSNPLSEYFLTCCTDQRQRGLEDVKIGEALLLEVARLENDGIWRVRTAVIMPDHLHLLVELGEKSQLSDAMRLFKGRTSVALRARALRWERGYFDHRMRNEDRLPVFLYIFLNPYRAELVAQSQRWPGYYCCAEDWEWFGPLTNTDCPFPEWLR